MGAGRGSGYHNLVGKDPHVHSQSARGIKQPQRITQLKLRKFGLRWRKLNIPRSVKGKFNPNDTSQLDFAFKKFIDGGRKTMENRHVWRIGVADGDIFIKERYNKDVALRDVRATNLLADKYAWQPQAIYREHDGKHYVIASGVKGYDNQRPIQMLMPEQKVKLADMTNTLYQHGIVNYDLRNDNVYIDNERNPVIIDLDQAEVVKDTWAREVQYNINIAGIFGFKNLKEAKPYMTLTLKQIGYDWGDK
jgi:hypothetical protein